MTITVSIDPAVRPGIVEWQSDMLTSMARAFGISYDLISRDYVDMKRRQELKLKAYRLCSRAGFNAARGKRGQGRKLKRAVQILRKIYGPNYPRSSVLMHYQWSYDLERRQQWFAGVFAQWAEENRFLVRPKKWKGPGRGEDDATT